MLGEDVQAMALCNAYAIDMPAPDTLTRPRERIAGIHGLSIDTIELYERNMIDELALRLVHAELPVLVDKREVDSAHTLPLARSPNSGKRAIRSELIMAQLPRA